MLFFRYSHVFIPILPTSLIEVLSTPTPFIMGVHSVHEREIQEVLDTIVVDLDGGALALPENYKIYMVQDTLLNKTRQELSLVLNPDLNVADHAFQVEIILLNIFIKCLTARPLNPLFGIFKWILWIWIGHWSYTDSEI